MKFRLFLLSFIILFLLSLAAGFPNAPFTHRIINGNSGKGETYGLELVSLLIDFVVAGLVALTVTVFWFYLKNDVRQLIMFDRRAKKQVDKQNTRLTKTLVLTCMKSKIIGVS